MQDELPESLLGAVRLQNLDLSKAGVLDLETGNITRRSWSVIQVETVVEPMSG